MVKLSRRAFWAVSSLLVPFLTLLELDWISLLGVGPCWSVLWLLPWSIVDGPFSGLMAGLFLGLVLDGLSLGDVTYLPALMILGFWWGRLGQLAPPIEQKLTLGLLSWIGTVLVGLSFWIQFLFTSFGKSSLIFHAWSFHTIFAQSIITGLIAPFVCTYLIWVFRFAKPISINK